MAADEAAAAKAKAKAKARAVSRGALLTAREAEGPQRRGKVRAGSVLAL